MTRLVVLGGFLGAGKTTLVSAAMRRLSGAACVTNDQAKDLVDTAAVARLGAVREVAGSCFCCDFEALARNARELADEGARHVLAEAVGSCTDLVATVIRPLEDGRAGDFDVAPLTVVVDPKRLRHVVFADDGRPSGLHRGAAYIYAKQIEEADVIALNKIDTVDEATRRRLVDRLEARFGVPVVCTDASAGEGVDAWLRLLEDVSLRRPIALDLDYDLYAMGEAALGWLNATGSLRGAERDWGVWLGAFMAGLRDRCAETDAPVGHLKAMARVGGDEAFAACTSRRDEVRLTGRAVGAEATWVLNARVELPPAALEALVRDVARHDPDAVATFEALRCFSPPPPVPTHRVPGPAPHASPMDPAAQARAVELLRGSPDPTDRAILELLDAGVLSSGSSAPVKRDSLLRTWRARAGAGPEGSLWRAKLDRFVGQLEAAPPELTQYAWRGGAYRAHVVTAAAADRVLARFLLRTRDRDASAP